MKTKIMLLIGIISLISVPAYAGFLDNGGINFQYATYLPKVVESASHHHRAHRYMGWLGKDLSKHWELEGEFHFSRHFSSPKNASERHFTARETGINAVIHYRFRGSEAKWDPYIGWFAGLSWLIDTKEQPNWAESGVLGSWGPMIGLNIPIMKNNGARIEFRISHTSDPFGSDSGRNLRCISVGVIHWF
jgi:hypothetical protein